MTPASVSVVVALGLAVLAILLLWLLQREIAQRRQLMRWLDAPRPEEIPDGLGQWLSIFSALQRLRKAELKGQLMIAAGLERFRQAAQALPDGVALLDLQGHIEWMNGAVGQHLSLDPARDIGTLIELLIRRSDFLEYWEKFRTSEVQPPLVLSLTENQQRRVLSLLLIPFADEGILLLSRDITEIARTEIMRRDFIANVSHELRTPLTVISGFLEQMDSAEQLPQETVRHFMRLMNEQAQRMNRLVGDLLTLSRLECDTEPPATEIVDIPAMMTTLVAEGRALSQGQHRIELGEVSAGFLHGSSEEIRSAFGNLVSNAVRYSPHGGKITLAWQQQINGATFSVSDTGIGIPAEHIPRLTERFYRVDKGRSSSTGGTGLGLAIVKHVLARHRGKLMIHSEIGKGSVFSVSFPGEMLCG